MRILAYIETPRCVKKKSSNITRLKFNAFDTQIFPHPTRTQAHTHNSITNRPTLQIFCHDQRNIGKNQVTVRYNIYLVATPVK